MMVMVSKERLSRSKWISSLLILKARRPANLPSSFRFLLQEMDVVVLRQLWFCFLDTFWSGLNVTLVLFSLKPLGFGSRQG